LFKITEKEIAVMQTLKQETLKQAAVHAVSHLPDSADIDEIMYRLYVLDKVRKGREAARNGETVTPEQLREEIGVSEDDIRREQIKIIDLFGTIDFDPEYDYKIQRSKK
jgi:hypothetical protein